MLNIKQGTLLCGQVDESLFRILVEISSIHSERVILAMRDYLVHGHSRKDVCNRYCLNNGYFSVSLSRLVRVNQLIISALHYYSYSGRKN
ncbi:PapB/FocB family fimbrial expression transcriptional regulator [Escherichia coli]|uniref:PapB/FocB family fimbrial expression transcriptional regulator n=1 Tax=Escherichia coli TaxID=562 RepID=UPI000C7972D5|nr:PapB/FocB family fimbrial expression transcriptional regulator [Escherichia coli]AUM10818.1 transcriptional regulator [Escherichia coli]MBZ8327430.1 transcriptional regulator [Escherichia coli]